LNEDAKRVILMSNEENATIYFSFLGQYA